MKKQQGFTLIELMVVMAIIAILATAGLSAYTGYIKKARDATRIADIKAIESIVIGSLSISGKPPQTSAEVHTLVVAANGKGIYDPLSDQTLGLTTKNVCSHDGINYNAPCFYAYRVCDGGMGFVIATFFESKSNYPLQLSDPIGGWVWYVGSEDMYDSWAYEVGSCTEACMPGPGCPDDINGYAPGTITSAPVMIGKYDE